LHDEKMGESTEEGGVGTGSKKIRFDPTLLAGNPWWD